jgi:hypothetical protein
MLVGLAAILISLASSAYLFRGYLSGIYIGEIFDTRLMIILHEHWFRFFTGETSFLDAGFFYPYPRSFALTDTFLLTGITHSTLRFFGLEIIDAWALSQLIWVFFGLLGWFFLARKIIENKFLQLLTVPLIATSYPFVAHLNERPNVVPYLLVSWVFLFLFNFYFADSKKLSTLNLGFFLVALPLIVLTSWYAGFFIVIFIVFLIAISSITRAIYLKNSLAKIKNLDAKIFTPFALTSLGLTFLWAYIYLPELSHSAEVARPKHEVIERSPAIIDLFSTPAVGKNLFISPIYIPEKATENLIGLSFILFLALLFILLYVAFLNSALIPRKNKQFLFSLLASGLMIEIIIIKFFNDTSIFIILFDQISFLKSIRAPVRWHIYLSFLFIIILIYLINLLLKNKIKRVKFLILLIPILILIEQQRTPPGLWTKDQFIDTKLLSYKSITQDCEAFVLDRPDTGYWLDMIEGITLSVFLGIPSVNGYSGSIPKNYPSISWFADGDLPAIGTWLLQNESIENVCLLDGSSFDAIRKFDSEKIEFISGSGFTGWETLEDDNWNWSVWEQSLVHIQSLKSSDESGFLKFTIQIPKCLDGANFRISIRNDLYEPTINASKSTTLEIPITLMAWERLPIVFEKDPGFCNVDGDPRDLHFSVKNMQLE